MSQESTIYLVNLIIGTILAVLMTQSLRRDGPTHGLRYWAIAAWTLAIADLFFALRPVLPHFIGRLVPTLLVTIGHGVLLLAAQRAAEARITREVVSLVSLVHGVILVVFLVIDADSSWRTVTNGVTWGGLSLASAAVLWQSPPWVRRAFSIPAAVFLWQAVFHLIRTLAATRDAVSTTGGGTSLIQLLGDLEVSLFIVALFVSVLVGHLREANTQLREALGDVRQLSALLRICAWCRKVRTDEGHWTQLEQYLVERRIEVTHAICESCSAKAGAGGTPPMVPDPTRRIT